MKKCSRCGDARYCNANWWDWFWKLLLHLLTPTLHHIRIVREQTGITTSYYAQHLVRRVTSSFCNSYHIFAQHTAQLFGYFSLVE
jgi:hypothetical protein